MVYRLKKALYGLKQAPRAWNERIDTFLRKKLGFKRSVAYPNLYTHMEQGRTTAIVLYVDDLTLTGDDTDFIEKTKVALESKFERTDMGLLHFFLGFEIWKGEKGIFSHSSAMCKSCSRP